MALVGAAGLVEPTLQGTRWEMTWESLPSKRSAVWGKDPGFA